MSVFVFLGPSLPVAEAESLFPAARFHGPVSQGDVMRAVLSGARAIGIVDGYFERVPAVWHKEILWAMDRGVHVFGASSMGALRAAELHVFGMVGVGAVFEAFRDGVLEDDDEVAVIHGPAETGYLPISVAMVDIRATLDAALAATVLSGATHAALLALAKETYYPDRTYPDLLDQATAAGLLSATERAALAEWLPGGRVGRKAGDARAMLVEMARFLAGEPGSKTVSYYFEATDAWAQVLRRDGHQVAAALPSALSTEGLLDEMRLLGRDVHTRVLTDAFVRALALREAERDTTPVDPATFREVLHAFFLERGLRAPADIAAWIDRQGLDSDKLTALIMREVRIERVKTRFREAILGQLPDALRVASLHGDLAARAEDKGRWLESTRLHDADAADWGQDEAGLLRWHFEDRLGTVVPEDVDGHARALGFSNRHTLVRMLLRDYLYSHRRGSQGEERSTAPSSGH